MYEAPAINGLIHRMIKVNFQLTVNDAIKPAKIEDTVIVNNLKSRPMPFSIVWMLLEKNSVVRIGRCDDEHPYENSFALDWLCGFVSKNKMFYKWEVTTSLMYYEYIEEKDLSDLHVEVVIEREEYLCELFVAE